MTRRNQIATGLLIFILGLLAYVIYSNRQPVVVATLLAILTAVDLGAASLKLRHENREVPQDAASAHLAKALVSKGLLVPGAAPPRISAPRMVPENAGMRYGWSTFAGYASMMLGRVWHYIHAGIGLPVPTAQVAYPQGEILERGPFAYDSMALVVGTEPGTRRLVMRDSPDPRAYLVSAAVRVPDYRDATARMRDGHPFHRVALVERALPADIPSAPDEAFAGRAAITHFEAERITLTVASPRPAVLVLAEAWFPGWQAEVAGRPAECFPANAWMRAVLVPAGRSQVVFTYRSTYFALGAGISLATFALLVALCLRRRRARA